jgi:hypothetical protein
MQTSQHIRLVAGRRLVVRAAAPEIRPGLSVYGGAPPLLLIEHRAARIRGLLFHGGGRRRRRRCRPHHRSRDDNQSNGAPQYPKDATDHTALCPRRRTSA